MAELLFFQRWQNFYTPRDGGIIILPEMAELLFSQRWRDYYSPRDGGIIILPEMAEDGELLQVQKKYFVLCLL